MNRRSDPANSIHFYDTQEWRKLRNWFIRANPLCNQCSRRERLVLAKVVDHIIPIEDGGEPLDVENLQSLCKPCHTAKTNKERGRGD